MVIFNFAKKQYICKYPQQLMRKINETPNSLQLNQQTKIVFYFHLISLQNADPEMQDKFSKHWSLANMYINY